MRKIIQLACLGIILLLLSCNIDSQSNEFNPLVLLSKYGSSSLTVHATYNGDPATDGSGKMYVYLFDELGTTSRDPIYKESTDAAVTIGEEVAIKVDHIRDGNYYVLVFYDYKGGDNNDNQTDRYVLYGLSGNTAFTSVASTYSVAGDTVLNGVSFGNMYKLQAQSRYLSTACSLAVEATYTGTAKDTGTGQDVRVPVLYPGAGHPAAGRAHLYRVN